MTTEGARERFRKKVRTALADRYVVEDEVGRGAMATVFRGRSGADIVAIKVLRPEFAATVQSERFHREIRILSNLDHPGILPVIDSGQANWLVYFVMPFASGDNLRTIIRREGRLAVEDAAGMLRTLADAIDYAHRQKIIHRDLKPENVVFDASGRPLVCDFGVARAMVHAGGERLTTSGLMVGTPHYMSPEQASGDQHLGGATDLYALGCLAYEMFTGEVPFTGVSTQVVIARHINQPPRPVRALRSELPRTVEQAIFWALSKKPQDRPKTAGAFIAAMGL